MSYMYSFNHDYHDHDHNLSYTTYMFLVYSFNHDYYDNLVLWHNLSYRCMRNHPFRRLLSPLRGLRPTRSNLDPHRVCAADSDIADHIQLADAAGARVANMG